MNLKKCLSDAVDRCCLRTLETCPFVKYMRENVLAYLKHSAFWKENGGD